MGTGGLFLLWVRRRDKMLFSIVFVSLEFPGVWRFQVVLYFTFFSSAEMYIRIIGYHYVVGLRFCSGSPVKNN